MKTFLIATESNIDKHAGETYDDYMIVKGILGQDEMTAVANQIRLKLRGVIIEAQKEGDKKEDTIEVSLDATSIYNVILVSLADLMLQEEKLNIVLPDSLKINEEENQVQVQRKELENGEY